MKTPIPITVLFPEGMHPTTQKMLVRFFTALAMKMRAAEIKQGFTDDWVALDADYLRQELAHHIAKGDPLDVAAYCAFLWAGGQDTSAVPRAARVLRPYWRSR